MRTFPVAAASPRRLLPAILVGAVLALVALLPVTGAPAASGGSGTATQSNTGPFDKHGMWIWYVSKSQGGSVPAIIAKAKKVGIGSVYIKAGDGTSPWSQFTSSLINQLHGAGLDVCAWQFVYGNSPRGEAQVGAAAVAKGADCLIIDAEGDYEGKYASASKYMNALRAKIGPSVPVSLAGFPYVDYHPGFPYSVFLAPGAADANQPQMYWKTIGASVAGNYAHTYLYNRVYKRPIYPIGQTYQAPGAAGIRKFRSIALNYGASGVSWWDWQETSGSEWRALQAPVARVAGFTPSGAYPTLKKGSKGDLVVQAQELLVGAGQTQLPVTGIFGGGTAGAVAAFQSSKGIGADGVLGTTTWRALLSYTPAGVNWAERSRSRAGVARAAHPAAPLSAGLPARRDEIPARLGR